MNPRGANPENICTFSFPCFSISFLEFCQKWLFTFDVLSLKLDA